MSHLCCMSHLRCMSHLHCVVTELKQVNGFTVPVNSRLTCQWSEYVLYIIDVQHASKHRWTVACAQEHTQVTMHMYNSWTQAHSLVITRGIPLLKTFPRKSAQIHVGTSSKNGSFCNKNLTWNSFDLILAKKDKIWICTDFILPKLPLIHTSYTHTCEIIKRQEP